MASLFIDSTHYLVCGLLDEQGKWMCYREILLKKSSELLHKTIFQMLMDKKIKASNLHSLLTITGPGSYTGVRLAEGMARVFAWQNIPVFSCRHFDIPLLLGIERGAFLAQAFKKEIFVYTWNQNTVDKKNLPETKLDEVVISLTKDDYPIFVSHESELFSSFEKKFTNNLLRENITELFHQMKVKKIRNPLYYYRHLEQEFTSSVLSKEVHSAQSF